MRWHSRRMQEVAQEADKYSLTNKGLWKSCPTSCLHKLIQVFLFLVKVSEGFPELERGKVVAWDWGAVFCCTPWEHFQFTWKSPGQSVTTCLLTLSVIHLTNTSPLPAARS